MADELVGLATAVGSFPGTDSAAAARLSLLETPEFWTVPELPDRGPGGEMIGRTLGILNSVSHYFAAGLSPTGWELASGPTRMIARAQSFLQEDFEQVEQVYLSDPASFSTIGKISVVGPLTLSASVGRPQSENLIADMSAVVDVSQALAESAQILIRDMKRRYPGLQKVVVQIDEPLLVAVLDGTLKNRATTSTLRQWSRAEAVEVLTPLVSAIHTLDAAVAFHGCTTRIEFELAKKIGIDALMSPLSQIGSGNYDQLAEFLDGGASVILGVDMNGYAMSDVGSIMGAVLNVTRRIGIQDHEAHMFASLSPECGLWNSMRPGADLEMLRHASEELRSL